MPVEELAAQHAALPPLQPPPQIDIQAAMDEARQHDERWMQQMWNVWQNEQQAQQQLQQDVEEEECQRLYEHRDLMYRQQRLEEVANNMSRWDIAGYQSQNNNDNDDFYVDPTPPHSWSPSPPLHRRDSPPPPPPPSAAAASGPARAPVESHSLGPMNLQCPNCHALHFSAEKLSNSTVNQLKFGMCCLTGQVHLLPFPPAPRHLRDLFDGTSPHSLEFKSNICQYNAVFAFTSLGVWPLFFQDKWRTPS